MKLDIRKTRAQCRYEGSKVVATALEQVHVCRLLEQLIVNSGASYHLLATPCDQFELLQLTNP
jgi:uncharacterized protein (UPF0179 family)